MATSRWDAIARSSGWLDGFQESHLAWLERAKRETGNPLFCWQAWHAARRAGKPPPDWVLAYFDEAAERLLHVAKDTPTKRADTAIAEALELSTHSGGRSRLSVFRERWERLDIAERVEEQIESGLTEDVAIEEVADALGTDERTVLKWWCRYRELVDY